ncbi:MAG: hypothetical protein AAGC73_04240 [Verrucomicrobiota bacterium]
MRHYFDDIIGPKNFPAINTSLSCFLLGSEGLLYLVAFHFQPARSPRSQTIFLLSQAGIFFYLCLDDRFLLHEQFGNHSGIDDHYILLIVGLLELALLASLGRE